MKYRCIAICIGAAIVITTIICVVAVVTRKNEWCNDNLSLGDCQIYNGDQMCYCIDRYNEQEGVFENAQVECANSGGNIATPEAKDLLIWLSKRLYTSKIYHAMIGLHKIDNEWFWQRPTGDIAASELPWRSDIPVDAGQRLAVINVETVKSGSGDDLKSRNYDHYMQIDKNYQWFGFATANTASHYICYYASKPETTSEEEEHMKRESIQHIMKSDGCECKSNAVIELMELDDVAFLTSPRYPESYCNNDDCKWIVQTMPGHRIKLQWIAFHVENYMDSVSVYNGENDNKTTLALCTGPMCEDVTSNKHSMQIHFKSNEANPESGFKAMVTTAVANDSCYCMESVIVSLEIGESFVLRSPNYPGSYCSDSECSWLFSAPDGYGVSIQWKEFQTESDLDFISIFDGDKAIEGNFLQRCSGSTCDDIISAKAQLYAHFLSNNQTLGKYLFKAMVIVAVNDCDKLNNSVYAPLGSLTYNGERSNGRIPVRESVTLTCRENSKVRNTENRTITTSCEAPEWEDELDICVPTCPLNVEPFSAHPLEMVQKCNDRTEVSHESVASGTDVLVMLHNKSGVNADSTSSKHYKCMENSWTPEQPVCHATDLAIMIMGGGTLSLGMDQILRNDPTKYYSSKSMQLYFPHNSTTILLNTTMSFYRQNQAVVKMSTGEVMRIGGSRYSKRQYDEAAEFDRFPGSAQIINPNTMEWRLGPSLGVEGRDMTAAVLLDEYIIVCGGFADTYAHTSCLRIHSDQCLTTTRYNLVMFEFLPYDMPEPRAGHAMIAHEHCLLVIGGQTIEFGDYLSSVIKYCLGTTKWQTKAPMSIARSQMATEVLDGIAYVCGGVTDQPTHHGTEATNSCESYYIGADKWKPMEPMSSARQQFTITHIKGRLYVGYSYLPYDKYDLLDGGVMISEIESYDIMEGHWRIEQLNEDMEWHTGQYGYAAFAVEFLF